MIISKTKVNVLNLCFIILTAIALLININLMYLIFLIFFIYTVKQEKKIGNTLLQLAIFSIVLPDNYTSEIFFFLYFIFYFIKEHGRKIFNSKYYIVLLAFLGVIFISIVLNRVPYINILFAVISFLPLLCFLVMMGKLEVVSDIAKKEKIKKVLNLIFYIEVTATIINSLLYSPIKGDDWSFGTFSPTGGQQAQFFIVSSFFVLYYYSEYKTKRLNYYLIYMLVASLLALSTNSWTLLMLFMVGIFFSYIIRLNAKSILIIMTAPLILLIGYGLIIRCAPEHISVSLYNIIHDFEYLSYRVHKLINYKDTFLTIPFSDLQFALFGTGIGYYCSRAALICTGKYVSFYNKLSLPSISKYTNKYLMEPILLAYNYPSTDYGSVLYRPYSSALSLMGECGYIGFLLFFILVKKLYIKLRANNARTLLVVWLMYCLLENYLEYSKVIVILFFMIVTIYEKSEKRELLI